MDYDSIEIIREACLSFAIVSIALSLISLAIVSIALSLISKVLDVF